MAEIHELRPKTPDSEKITVNLGFIDLGRVDLMLSEQVPVDLNGALTVSILLGPTVREAPPLFLQCTTEIYRSLI